MLNTKNDLMATITSYMGGRTAEEMFFDDVTTGASNDIERATNLAKDMVTLYGMSDLGPIKYNSGSENVFLGRAASIMPATMQKSTRKCARSSTDVMPKRVRSLSRTAKS